MAEYQPDPPQPEVRSRRAETDAVIAAYREREARRVPLVWLMVAVFAVGVVLGLLL